jgi:signal transduction histidine kinase
MVPRAQLRLVGTAFLRRRPWIVGPGMFVTVGALILSGAPQKQVVALSVGMTLMLGFFVFEATRREPFSERYLARSLLITLFGISVACFATGGIRSPVSPFLFAPTVVAFAAFGRTRPSVVLFASLLLSVALLSAVPSPFPAIAPPYDVVIALTAFALAATLLRLGVASLTDAYANAASDLDVAREALVASAEARSRALEGLGAKVAHEIKNPLASVRGLVELTASEQEGRARTRLDVVLREVERIETILRDYLSFAKPLAEVHPVDSDLRAVCEALAATLDGRARRSGISLDVTGSGRAKVDPARISEALLNLVANAIEATPPGGSIVVTVEGSRVTVADTGRGIADLARIGTPGYTTKSDGTGLGVALARGVIVQHGGTLSFTSDKAGTTATVQLP